MADTEDGMLAPRRSFQIIRRLARHRSFRIGFIIVLVLTLAAIFAPSITGYDPTSMRARIRFRPPQAAYWFGTDNFGRDVFTRCLYGARLSLTIGLGVALLSGVIGAAAGIVSAQFRRLDSLLPMPSRPANELPVHAPSSSSVTVIPLFQRDCCYLL